GSRLVLEKDRLIDSVRGPRGAFVPVPDMKIAAVTATEANRYAAQAAYYQHNWKQMDPLMVGMKRFSLKGGKERLVVDGNLSLLAEEKYGWLLSILGPPTKEQISRAPGDIITVEASLKGGLLLPSVPPHYMFARLQDTAAPQTDLKPKGLFKTIEILRTTPGYIGAWPKPGLLDMLPFGLGGRPDPRGYSKMLFGLWRWQGDGFSVLSFDQPMLERVTPQLRREPADDPAQLRIHVGDLSKSKLAPWVSSLNYQRALQTSNGNLRLMHALSQQLGVPRDDALATAEDLLNVKMVCTLGGEYKMAKTRDGLVHWQTTKWQNNRPAEFEAPMLKWFRGLDASLTRDGDRLMLHAEIDMQRKDSGGGGFKLPSFNLFGKPKA
ncbi:MAG: hypothetical protein IH991_24260, partial [Planctomycetes bacterium]|nr:hypothetical protein [Planctomycetota bacterium]